MLQGFSLLYRLGKVCKKIFVYNWVFNQPLKLRKIKQKPWFTLKICLVFASGMIAKYASSVVMTKNLVASQLGNESLLFWARTGKAENTVWLVFSFTRLDSTASLHTNDNIFSSSAGQISRAAILPPTVVKVMRCKNIEDLKSDYGNAIDWSLTLLEKKIGYFNFSKTESRFIHSRPTVSKV